MNLLIDVEKVEADYLRAMEEKNSKLVTCRLCKESVPRAEYEKHKTEKHANEEVDSVSGGH